MILTQIQTQLVPVAMLVQRSLRSFDSASRVYNSHVENAPTGLAQGNVAAHAYDHTASRILVILENDETTWFTFCPLFLRRQFEHRPYHSQLAEFFRFLCGHIGLFTSDHLVVFRPLICHPFPETLEIGLVEESWNFTMPKVRFEFY